MFARLVFHRLIDGYFIGGKMTTIDVNNYSFEYKELGSGKPLVFVHGSASDYRTWKDQQDEFAKHFRTIVYSRRYHWPNEQIAEGVDYSMMEHVRDLEALLNSLNAAPAHLVGHSYGAFICMLLAVQKPQLIRTLVLAEPPAITLFVSNTPKPLEIFKLLFTRPRMAAAIIRFGVKGAAPAAKAFKQNDRDEALRIFAEASLGAEAYRGLSKSRLEQARANLIKAELLGSGFPPLMSDDLRRIQNPTLLLNGQSSPPMYHYLMDRIEELLPNAERTEIPNAFHIMHEDNKSSYNTTVLSFLERINQ
jgi:pimeloyl-ACP methyl ester carboxylesterase